MIKLYASSISRKIALGLLGVSMSVITHAQDYIQSACDFAPMATEGTAICLGDDAVSSAIPLGFTFSFYDVPFTDCYVSSNGYLSFTAGLGSACCTGQILPNGTYPYSIFFGQEDLDPNSCVDGTISYYTTGAPGSQVFVLSFVGVPHYPGPAGTFNVTVQVQLYEGTNEIRIVTTEYNSDGGNSTMGLNESATNADVVPDRNSSGWSAYDECISFVPSGLPDSGCTDPTAINYDPGADIDDGSCFFGYTYSTCTYDLMPTEGEAVCLGDDMVSAAIPMGFDFPFYGTMHSEAYISSNGFVTFNPGIGSGCCTGQILPNATYLNSIFMGQEDLDPNSCIDGVINYYTSGGAGSHIFVVNFVGVPHYPGPGGTFNTSMQLQLFEATGEIKVVVTEWNSDGGAATLGLNYNGTYADPAPGKNSEVWSAYEECHSWVPVGGVVDVCPAPTGLYVDGITTNDAVLHWDSVAGADQYRVTLYNLATGLIKKKGFYTNYVELIDKLTPMTEYGFRVTTVCYDEGLKSDPSGWVYFTTLGKFGENENTSLMLFPNPNNGTFTLSLNGLASNNFDLMVYDALGNVVYGKTITADSNSYTENISLDVPAGMYHVSIMNEMSRMDYPIVIQK